MRTLEMNENSLGERIDRKQRIRVRRLIRRALTLATFAAAVVLPQAAKAAPVTANAGDNITINNNAISNPPGGTLNPGDSVLANAGGTVNMTNGTTVSNPKTSQLIKADGAAASITGDNVTVNVGSYYIGILAINGGHLTFDNSTITGTYAPFVPNAPAPGEGIQTVEAQGTNSIVDLTNVTVNTTAFDNDYQSAGISAYGGGTVNLTNVIINSIGDVTYGIMDEADDGHIVGNNVTIITNGDTSRGVFTYGALSTIDLTGGSITTKGINSDGVYVLADSKVNLTNLTVTVNDPSSNSVKFSSSTTGSLTADNTTLNGNVVGRNGSGGTLTLRNSSILKGSVNLLNGTLNMDASSIWHNDGDSHIGTYNTGPGGSTVTMDVFADGPNSTSDQININNYSGGPTLIIPLVTGGSGELPGSGITLVQGTSSTSFFDGDFVSAPVNLGFHTYTGEYSDTSGAPQFLLSSQLNSTAVGASVLPALGSRTILSTLPTVQDRMHAPRLSVTGTGDGDAQKGIWARLFGGSNKFRSADSADNGFDTSLWAVQAGYDLMAKKDANGGRSYAGVYLAYGNSSGNAQLNGRNVGDLDLNATSAGAYWTKYSPSDLYLSITGQYSWLNGIKASGGGENISPSGSGFAISLEGGKTLNREKSMLIEPQAQLIYSHTNIDDSTLGVSPSRPVATRIRLSNLNSVTGRLGVLFQKNPNSGKNFLPWARVNLWHTFSGNSTMSSPGLDDIGTSMKGTSAELTAGFNLLGNKDSRWAINADAGYLFNLSGAKNTGWRGSLGAKYSF